MRHAHGRDLGGSADPGLQPERTALAWRRTALSFAVAGLAAMKLLGGPYGILAIVPGAVIASAGLLVAYLSMRRHRHHQRHFAGQDGNTPLLPDGRLSLLMTIAAAGSGTVALLVLWTLHA